MTIRKETTLQKATASVTIQIRSDWWEDEYGTGHSDSDVFYRLVDGKRVEEKIVTPQCAVLSDIFDCPSYYESTIRHFRKQGFRSPTDNVFYTFDYDHVLKFEGWYDPLYGVVSVEDMPHSFPHKRLEMNKTVWRTEKEATAALIVDCRQQLKKAEDRMAALSSKNYIPSDLPLLAHV